MLSTLTPEETKLFFELWNPFQDYMNWLDKITFCFDETENLNEPDNRMNMDFHYQWSDMIDEYLKKTKLPPEHREIVESWKRAVSGEFVLERHLKKGTAFISMKYRNVYIVKGLDTSLEDMFPELPVSIQTTLLPFRDKIIYDSTITDRKAIIGNWNTCIYTSFYSAAKQSKVIVTSL